MHNLEDDFDDSDDDFDSENDDLAPSEILPCPACGAEVYEDAQRCPHCGEYIVVGGTSPLAGRGPWWIALGIAGVVALLLWQLFGV